MDRLFKLRRGICAVVLSLICLLGLTITANAAKAPGQVKGLKASSVTGGVKLAWKKVNGANGYFVYMTDPRTNETKKAANVKGASKVKATIGGLDDNVKYKFCVAAYVNNSGQPLEGKKSAVKAAATKKATPATVNLKLGACMNGKVTIKWAKAARATGYEVYQQNSDGEFVKIKTMSKRKLTIGSLNNNEYYYFRVRSYNKTGGKMYYGNFSNIVKAMPKENSSASKVQSIIYKAKITSSFSKGGKTFKAGQSVNVVDRTSDTGTIQLSNGKKITVSNSMLRYTSFKVDPKHPYSQAVAEEYVNGKGYNSKSKYLIWVSIYKQRVYIFKGKQFNWKLDREYKCSSGTFATPTPRGVNPIMRKQRIFQFKDPCFAYYASHFRPGVAIHSELYWTDSPNSALPGQPIGERPLSHGCVRVYVKQAKWVYDNCPMGTTVVRF